MGRSLVIPQGVAGRRLGGTFDRDYAGRAFDINNIDGQGVTPAINRALLNRFVAVCSEHGANEILHPFNRTRDHQDHLHVGWRS